MFYVLCIFLPLIGAAIAGLLGPWIKGRGAMVVTCGALLISALISPFILAEVGLRGHPCASPFGLLPRRAAKGGHFRLR